MTQRSCGAAESVAGCLLSGVFVALRSGGWAMQRACRAETSPYSRFAAGAFVLSFIAALPWIGWLVWILAPAIGLGALLLDRKSAGAATPRQVLLDGIEPASADVLALVSAHCASGSPSALMR